VSCRHFATAQVDGTKYGKHLVGPGSDVAFIEPLPNRRELGVRPRFHPLKPEPEVGCRKSARSGNSDVCFHPSEATRKQALRISPDQLIVDTAYGH
jgi:hypothetical protein